MATKTKKRRVLQHNMEDESRALVRRILPTEWVVRDYVPDYGIDIAVEVFERVSNSTSTVPAAEAAGEWFFVQVRSTSRTVPRKLRVYPSHNVETRYLQENMQSKRGTSETDTIPCRIDTSLLLTVQSLGCGVPVLLFLVTLDTKSIYFVCINDFIDKCILPNDDQFEEKKTKTIHVPLQNALSLNPKSLIPLKFLAKRSKLYSAFSKFSYQENEIRHLIERARLSTTSGNDLDLSTISTLLGLVRTIKKYDFWKTTSMWEIIPHMYEDILELERRLVDLKTPGSISEDQALAVDLMYDRISATWQQLKNLNNVYEELCREWFLPTDLGTILVPNR